MKMVTMMLTISKEKKASIPLRMELFTAASGWVGTDTDTGSRPGQMGLVTRVNGSTIRPMGGAFSTMWMEMYSTANGRTTRRKATAFLHGKYLGMFVSQV